MLDSENYKLTDTEVKESLQAIQGAIARCQSRLGSIGKAAGKEAIKQEFETAISAQTDALLKASGLGDIELYRGFKQKIEELAEAVLAEKREGYRGQKMYAFTSTPSDGPIILAGHFRIEGTPEEEEVYQNSLREASAKEWVYDMTKDGRFGRVTAAIKLVDMRIKSLTDEVDKAFEVADKVSGKGMAIGIVGAIVGLVLSAFSLNRILVDELANKVFLGGLVSGGILTAVSVVYAYANSKNFEVKQMEDAAEEFNTLFQNNIKILRKAVADFIYIMQESKNPEISSINQQFVEALEQQKAKEQELGSDGKLP